MVPRCMCACARARVCAMMCERERERGTGCRRGVDEPRPRAYRADDKVALGHRRPKLGLFSLLLVLAVVEVAAIVVVRGVVVVIFLRRRALAWCPYHLDGFAAPARGRGGHRQALLGLLRGEVRDLLPDDCQDPVPVAAAQLARLVFAHHGGPYVRRLWLGERLHLVGPRWHAGLSVNGHAGGRASDEGVTGAATRHMGRTRSR